MKSISMYYYVTAYCRRSDVLSIDEEYQEICRIVRDVIGCVFSSESR